VPALALTHLLRAAMVESDIRHSVDDLFAIQLQNNSQHTVSSGMLWADIEKKKVGAVPTATHAPGFGLKAQGLLLALFLLFRQLEWTHLRRTRRVIFPQRVPNPGIWHEQSLEMRMILERDSEPVPDFSLVPIGSGPDGRDRR